MKRKRSVGKGQTEQAEVAPDEPEEVLPAWHRTLLEEIARYRKQLEELESSAETSRAEQQRFSDELAKATALLGQMTAYKVFGSSLFQSERSVEVVSMPPFPSSLGQELVVQVREPKVWSSSDRLTGEYLTNVVGPYIQALSDIQLLIDEIKQRHPTKVRIRSIRENSPVSVSLEGGAEAIRTVQDMVVPWMREHAKAMAHLTEEEKEASIERAKAEVVESRVRAAKSRAEKDKLLAEAARLYEEARRIHMETERARFELQRDKLELALKIVSSLNPNLPDAEKLNYVIRLLPALDTIISSPLTLVVEGAGDESSQRPHVPGIT